MVYDARKIIEARGAIEGYWLAEAEAGRLPELPMLPEYVDELVTVVKAVKARLPDLREAALEAVAQAEPLRRLFPYGLDIDGCLVALETERLLRALRANMKDTYIPPAAMNRLTTLAARGEGPLFEAIATLGDQLGADSLSDDEIVTKRNAITEEILRLQRLAEHFGSVGNDLKALREAGAPQWSDACLQEPREAPGLLPTSWREAWDWAVMRGRIDAIVGIGNGDNWRERKTELAKQREYALEQLIRLRTLLGLKRRLTGPVQTALAIFTQGIRKLGKGTGKSAGRWRMAIRKAAMEAASAVPVWVMPEYKIAEQLAPELADFDLVILDEASQSDVTAIAALARGKKHLIVGDEQQVSPASVGIPQNKIDVLRAEYLGSLPNKNVIDASTSIFEVAMQMFPQRHLILREHFRCVEPIIQFSTRFYSGRLMPLRVPKASERFEPPLVDVFVNGGERRGKTNHDEARFIVDKIAAIASDPNHILRDVAVISLIGREQAELIERMLMEDPRVGTETMERMRLVCGDARTMQGQERSVVFLSMVATPETAIMQNNRDAGQRFNVAVSRARDRLYLVRSVSHEDLKPGDLKRALIEHFADPMPEGRTYTGQSVLARCASGFEREVCTRLIDANYRVRSQVKAGPFSIDLVVEGADDRRLAIELDGDAWHGPEKWDQDMSRQAALERAGWTFWRVFGSQWVSDREYWWNHLLERLRVMGIEPIGAEAIDDIFTENRVFDVSMGQEDRSEIDVTGDPAAGDTAGGIIEREVRDTGNEPPLAEGRAPEGDARVVPKPDSQTGTDAKELGTRHTAVVPITKLANQPAETAASAAGGDRSPVTPRPDGSRFYEDSYRETLRLIVWNIIDGEGPITFKHLCERVARLHGFQRTGSHIKETISQALKTTRSRSHGKGDGAVIWPKDKAISEWVPFRGLNLNGESRHWADVPLPEKLGLARMIAAQSSPDPENAMREALGMARLRAKTRAEIKSLLEAASTQRVAENDSVPRASNVSYLDKRSR